MKIHDVIRQAREANDFEPVNQLIPWAVLIGVECQMKNDEPLFYMPPKDTNIGNPVLPAIHGGVVASFMQHAAAMHLLMTLETDALPRMIDFSIDYLRSAQVVDSWASCQLHKQGRRVVNVGITLWQQDQNKPVATARSHFKI